MKFRKVPIDNSKNSILAHTLSLKQKIIKKGEKISLHHIELMKSENIQEIYVISLEKDDIHEDIAAFNISKLISGSNIVVNNVLTGRCNMHAKCSGMLVVNPKVVNKLNRISSKIALATLAPNRIVKKGQLISNVKIIPFAIENKIITKIMNQSKYFSDSIYIEPIKLKKASLIITRSKNTRVKILEKAEVEIIKRLERLNVKLIKKDIVYHDDKKISETLQLHLKLNSELILIHGYSSIMDINDVIPTSIKNVGGKVSFHGIPVDPGNLLLLAKRNNTNIIGVPGCAKSPKTNGFDWVLEYICCNRTINKTVVAEMGIGGLLKHSYIR